MHTWLPWRANGQKSPRSARSSQGASLGQQGLGPWPAFQPGRAGQRRAACFSTLGPPRVLTVPHLHYARHRYIFYVNGPGRVAARRDKNLWPPLLRKSPHYKLIAS